MNGVSPSHRESGAGAPSASAAVETATAGADPALAPDGSARAAAHRVLVLVGHPRPGSLSHALADAYARGAREAGADVRTLFLSELAFSPDVTAPSICDQPLEPDLAEARRLIAWCSHVVLVYPTWWGTYPARLKALCDRLLAPGFAFAEADPGSGFVGLLSGRSGHVITTMDTPGWVYRWIYRSPGHNAMRRATLGFCGIAPVAVTAFGPVKGSTPAERARWLDRAFAEGRRLWGAGPTRSRFLWRKAGGWLRAARLQFYPMTWLAYSVGAVHAAGAAALAHPAYWTGYAVLFLLELATVLINEQQDLESDRRNRHFGPFTGGSRVLVEGVLDEKELWRGVGAALALFVAAAVLLLAIAPSGLAAAAVLVPLAVLALGYTAPPLKLAYRSLGELVVALTHSLGVLLAGHVFMGGALADPMPWLVSAPLALSVLPSITLAGVPDRAADAAAGKRTLAVRFGVDGAIGIAGLCTVASAGTALLWEHLEVGGGLYDGIGFFVLPHASLLAALLVRHMISEAGERRIDGLLLASLTYLVWFGAVPFYHLLAG